MADQEVGALKAKRGAIKGKLTRLQNHFDKVNKETLSQNVITQLKLRVEKAESAWEEFNDIQSQLEKLEPSENDETERGQFEDLFFSVTGNIKTICADFEAVEINNPTAGSVHSGSNGSERDYNRNNSVKLPTIKLPSFDGQYGNWLEFRDAFKALVEDNKYIADIQKFYYLRSSLEKEAAQIIQAIEVSAANYKVAWQLLIDRFENKSLMIHNHIRAIYEYPCVNKESHTELRKLLDNVNKNLRSLKSLGEQTETWDRLIIYTTVTKCDLQTQRDWESFKYEGELPKISDLHNFLRSKCDILEKLELNKIEKHKTQPVQSYKKHSTNSFVTSTNKLQCYYCKENHPIYKCESFLKLKINERISAIKERKLCVNCMGISHASWSCSARKCIKCNKPHNSLLHLDINKGPGQTNFDGASVVTGGGATARHYDPVAPAARVSINNHTMASSVEIAPAVSQVLLSTALIKIKVNNDEFVTCRALLDSGSQSNFITENLCKKLNMQCSKVNHVVRGVGQALAKINSQVSVSILSCVNKYNMNIRCLVIPMITDKLPTISFDKAMLNIPNHLRLADPTFNMSSEIDMLLGSNVFWPILCSGQERLGKNLPILQNTHFGWVIGGKLHFNHSISCLNLDARDSIDDKIVKFWQLEETSNTNSSVFSKTEKYCEDHFNKTTKRDSDGRFIVEIPFKQSLENLGNSREVALSRFSSLERKLNWDPSLKKDYVNFMSEYEDLNHMQEIDELEFDLDEGYYLPHHAVIKATSLTTKCRVVFDASAKTDSGLSLNEVQFSGPTLQQDIFSILLRFRKHNYVITADISKMYRQVLIDDDQRKYQKVLWRSNANEKLKCYRLNTVTYGTASAPYLAVRCLLQLAVDNKSRAPVASKIITNDFFVDDLLTGADLRAEVLKIQRGISQILVGAGFELRKWLCNDKNILNNLEVNKDLEVSVLHVGENEPNKTLGILWNPNHDVIQYSVCNIVITNQVTKRAILSVICQIFDPLGLLGPIIIVAKLIMQELWQLKLAWDERVPGDLSLKWSRFLEELPIINSFKIPRHALMTEYIRIELHGFCDSSERAYGACLYLRCATACRRFKSELLCAKSRVAPLKQISLPRLELCGALLLANLAERAIDALEIKFQNRFFWTDSSVTLAWIRGAPKRWKTFIANRVSEIQSLTDIDDWRHVKSAENPADLLSRGTTPRTLSDLRLWWDGPEWFLEDNAQWQPSQVFRFEEQDIPEQRTVVNAITVQGKELDLVSTHSSLKKMQRILAYVIRFIKNAHLTYNKRQLGVLTPIELENSLNFLIKGAQQDCFSEEYKRLLNEQELNKRSKILSLNPFMKDNIIRVGGRIKNSSQSYDKRHPIILPKGHELTELILKAEHERLLHGGVQVLLCSIRERYWPVSGRNACKNIIRKCVTCFKARPTSVEYIMGDLPECRVNDYRPFQNVGIDFGGPSLLKDRSTRGAKLTKNYICLFVCMSTKAVHIEVVSELTTRAFIATLYRFVSRRGKPTNIYSDNGLNFVGANNELAKVYEFLRAEANDIGNHIANERIKWHFIPARSPSFGGIWEAGIKSAKFHIKRVIGIRALTFEDFSTVLTQIEGILNSRPICPLSSDHEDLAALTPGHFLIGKSLTAFPEMTLLDVPENRLSRYQRLQSMVQHFWSRWQKEYLTELQVRTKWRQNSQQKLKVGALVLVKDDNAPTLSWKLGRIISLHPGNDGVTRVVGIKVQTGQLKRAVNRVCALPVD